MHAYAHAHAHADANTHEHVHVFVYVYACPCSYYEGISLTNPEEIWPLKRLFFAIAVFGPSMLCGHLQGVGLKAFWSKLRRWTGLHSFKSAINTFNYQTQLSCRQSMTSTLGLVTNLCCRFPINLHMVPIVRTYRADGLSKQPAFALKVIVLAMFPGTPLGC